MSSTLTGSIPWDVHDVDRDDIAESYESQLTDWDQLPYPADSVGRGSTDQRFTVIFVAIDDEDLVVTIQSLND